jgi:hypothetical protein
MVARMALAVWPFGSRSWNDLKTEKIAPSFGASVNVAPSRPAKAAVEKTPGIDVRISGCLLCPGAYLRGVAVEVSVARSKWRDGPIAEVVA